MLKGIKRKKGKDQNYRSCCNHFSLNWYEGFNTLGKGQLNQNILNRSDQLELIYLAESVFRKATDKFDEVVNELNEEEKKSDLVATIGDTLKNLNRKINAHQRRQIDMDKLVSEFLFEREVLLGELENSKEENQRVKRLAKRILISVEEFLEKTHVEKASFKLKRLKEPGAFKSTKIAYLLWLVGGFGTLGFHRFYLEKYGTGIGWFMTGGMFFAGSLYDLVTLGKQVNENNNIVEEKYHETKRLQEVKKLSDEF